MSPAPRQPDQETYAGRFAARLRELREKAKLSVDDVVVAIGEGGGKIATSTYYNWESGTRQPPYEVLPLIAGALKLKTVRALFPER